VETRGCGEGVDFLLSEECSCMLSLLSKFYLEVGTSGVSWEEMWWGGGPRIGARISFHRCVFFSADQLNLRV
jgi:hypothetical protein